MQHIQDKDFDQLFKDRFEDAEIQPSAELWNKIKKEIEPKEKKKLPVFWMAAASVLLAVSLAVYLNKPDKIQLTGKTDVAQVQVGDNHQHESKKDTNETSALDKNNHHAAAQSVELRNHSSQLRDVAKSPNEKVTPSSNESQIKEENNLLAMQPNAGQSHLNNTNISTKASDINPSEIRQPAIEELPAVQVAIAGTANSEGNALTDETLTVNTDDAEAEQTGRLRIRNAGDLVNFVVEKLDKREQKLLEFKTDDDDNTSLVAINIGPIKLNSRKHK